MAMTSPSYLTYAEVDPDQRGAIFVSSRTVQLKRAAAIMIADFIAVSVSFMAAVLIACIATAVRRGQPLPLEQVQTAIFHDLFLFGGIALYFWRRAHYTRRLPFWSALHDVIAASLAVLFFDGFWHFLTQEPQSRLLLELTWVFLPPALTVMRTLCRRVLKPMGLWDLRTVIIGAGEAALQAERALLSEPTLGYVVAGSVPYSALGTATGSFWGDILRRYRAELIVLTLDRHDSTTSAMTQSLLRQRIPFAVMPSLGGIPVLGVEQTSFFSHDTVMLTFRNNLAQPVSRLIKVVFDILAASALLVLVSPVLLLIAIVVKLDGGPALYSHRRIGAAGREFNCLKFRSMVPDATAVLHQVLARDPAAAAEWAATQKLRSDPRVTRVGRFLRKTSLDELPQLFNVLRLDMSLVGPRPIVRSEVSYYGDDIAFYCETRPGVTGLWQVSGRSDIGYDQRVQLDTWYVKNWTLWHDIAILAKTLPAVLRCRGAV